MVFTEERIVQRIKLRTCLPKIHDTEHFTEHKTQKLTLTLTIGHVGRVTVHSGSREKNVVCVHKRGKLINPGLDFG